MKNIETTICASLVVLLCSLIVFAQGDKKEEKTASFKGMITRSDTKQPVAAVKILLLDEKKSDKQDGSVETETDKEGNFSFSGLKPGKYTISIRAYFDREEDVPCQLLMGKIDEPNSKLIVATENSKKVEQIFITGFSIKAGKEIKRDFDLVCKSLFSK